MEELYDIHIHLIYGVDDGPSDIEESTEILKSLAGEGVRTLIATPHKRYGMFDYDIEKVEAHYVELKGIAEKLGITLLLGCEYHACGDMIDDLKARKVHTLADTNFVLCEFSFSTEEEEMEDAVYRLTANGYRPIVAHAERYGAVQENPYFCEELKKRGAFIQINSGSLLGEDGRKIRRAARNLLKYGLVDVVASDAHGIKYRKSSLAKAYSFVVKKYTECYAREIFTQLPLEILKNVTGIERKVSNE